MQGLFLVIRLLILTYFISVPVESEILKNLLQRGGKSISWKWKSNKPSEVQRRRRFLSDETAAWWKEMRSLRDHRSNVLSATNPLTPSEDIYFTGRIHHPLPFADPDVLPPPTTETPAPEANATHKSPLHHNLDSTLIRELIIEEHHKPSKIEFESASQRLREANAGLVQPNKTENETEATPDSKVPPTPPAESGSVSFVEYVVPGVEHVLPHVEYNNLEAIRELEELSVKPSVEYVEPYVEFVEPEIQYFATTRKTDISEKVRSIRIDDSSELEREFEEYEPIPFEESITIDRKRYLSVRSRENIATSKSQGQRVVRTGQNVKRTRIHRRNPEIGIPDEDYPTLEILPVVHFPCEEYSAPGYYADVPSRCQMFHICHEDGQRTSFLCPVGTVFNQHYLVCDWWYNVDCGNSLGYTEAESYEDFRNKKLIAAPSAVRKEIDNTTLPETHDSTATGTWKIEQKPPTQKKATPKDKSHNKLTKLSKKAMNYPIGYAILLREYMKSSPGHIRNRSSTTETYSEPRTDEFDNTGTTNKSEGVRESTNPKPKRMYLLKQKHEYFGGLKPFALSSERTIRESMRIKRIKMGHLPRMEHRNTTVWSLPPAPNYASWFEHKSSSEQASASSRLPQNDMGIGKEPKQKLTNHPSSRNLEQTKNVTERYEAMHSIQSFTHVKHNTNGSEKNKHTKTLHEPANKPRLPPKRYFLEGNREVSENETVNISVPKTKKVYPMPSLGSKTEQQSEARKLTKFISGNVLASSDSKNTSAQKKAYFLEPINKPTGNANKKFGERLCLTSCVSLFKPMRVIVNETKHRIYESTIHAKRTSPYIKPIKIRNMDRGEATTQPSPVYLGSEIATSKNNSRVKIGNETSMSVHKVDHQNIKLPRQDERTNTEFYYTSKFINRISNLVSEIKSLSDSSELSLSQNNSLSGKGKTATDNDQLSNERRPSSHSNKLKTVTISVEVEKNYLNGTSKHTTSGSNKNSTLQLPVIDGFNSSGSPKLHVDANATKKTERWTIPSTHIIANNSNHSLIKVNNGGYVVVKKVRLKRNRFTLVNIKDNKYVLLKQGVRDLKVNSNNSDLLSPISR